MTFLIESQDLEKTFENCRGNCDCLGDCDFCGCDGFDLDEYCACDHF